MRDLVLLLAIVATIPIVLKKPWTGLLVLAWLGYMSPHRLAYGFAMTAPWVFFMVLVLFIGLLSLPKEERGKITFTIEVKILLVFIVWMLITTVFSVHSAAAWQQWDKVWKIQLIIFLSLLLINNRERINALIWTIVLSLGFYGFKGGIFTLMTAGSYRVQGPSHTFIGGNNEIGLALLITIPLMRYLQLETDKYYVKLALNVMIFLTFIAVLGTHSRGALVAAVVMGVFLILKSRKRFFLTILSVLLIVGTISFAPQKWFDRMNTIETYEEDGSAMGRINAWWMAYNLANDRVLGAGYEAFQYDMFLLYAPFPDSVHDAHSIYFEILAEHGYIGLTIFLTLWLVSWLSAQQVIKRTKINKELFWMRDLASMLQVSMLAYAAGGIFLGLAYFDLPYHLIALVIILKTLLNAENEKKMEEKSTTSTTEKETVKYKLLDN